MKKQLITVLTSLAILIIPASSIGAGLTKQEAVSELVHHMGYGAAIHDFKNFALRGKEKYMNGANAHYSHIEIAAANLRKQNLSESEKVAVNNIEKVMKNYQAALTKIQHLVSSGKSVKEIDREVKISDGPAVAGLKTLGAGSGSELAKIEHNLGYGGAIHNFKNCVIRTNSDKCTKAKAGFDETLKVLDGMDGALANDIKTTVSAYLGAIPTVTKMIRQGKSAEEIDAMIKISDGPAKAGIAALRKH